MWWYSSHAPRWHKQSAHKREQPSSSQSAFSLFPCCERARAFLYYFAKLWKKQQQHPDYTTHMHSLHPRISDVWTVCVFIIIYSLLRALVFSRLLAIRAPATYKCAPVPIKYSFSPWLVIPSSNTCAHSVLTKLPWLFLTMLSVRSW